MPYTPTYLNLSDSQLNQRAREAREILTACTLCPWTCRVNRLTGETGHCQAPGEAVVASYNAHFGEEPELVGFYGSGTIFFAHCNLDCLFCQNWEISHSGSGRAVDAEVLARIMLSLQSGDCHNINLVTPTPHVAAILEALPLAVQEGLKLPLVYNCGGYESLETLRLLEGIVDIYMPDLKYWDPDVARQYSGPPDYPDRAREALKEMQRQVGDLETDRNGIARRGLIVRHLVLPENLAGTGAIVQFLREEISPHCAVNIMRQYYPAYKARDYPPLDRSLRSAEYAAARKTASDAGLRLLK